MRLAANVAVAEKSATKRFTDEEFRQAMHSSFFTGAVTFWKSLEQLASPESITRMHAMGVLKVMALQAYEDCNGHSYSPQQLECLEYCGLKPKGVRPPGAGIEEKSW
jgi:hypothetical protein